MPDNVVTYQGPFAPDQEDAGCLFISDARDGSCDEARAVALEWQLDWVREMRPAASLLKVSFPYHAGTSEFFDGEILLQPWAPLGTGEVRMVVTADEIDFTRTFDHHEHEERMSFFSRVVRESAYGVDLPCNCYDCWREFEILCQAPSELEETLDLRWPRAVPQFTPRVMNDVVLPSEFNFMSLAATEAVMSRRSLGWGAKFISAPFSLVCAFFSLFHVGNSTRGFIAVARWARENNVPLVFNIMDPLLLDRESPYMTREVVVGGDYLEVRTTMSNGETWQELSLTEDELRALLPNPDALRRVPLIELKTRPILAVYQSLDVPVSGEDFFAYYEYMK
jgi:hypothetical protein